jgi:hypothetical protein
MDHADGSCPMSQSALIDQSFMEYRNHLIALASFLDRLDRSVDRDAPDDFRMRGLRRAIGELGGDEPGRVERIQMILSDRDIRLLGERDSQSAFGAAIAADGGVR